MVHQLSAAARQPCHSAMDVRPLAQLPPRRAVTMMMSP